MGVFEQIWLQYWWVVLICVFALGNACGFALRIDAGDVNPTPEQIDKACAIARPHFESFSLGQKDLIRQDARKWLIALDAALNEDNEC